jgi:hypothetical protein
MAACFLYHYFCTIHLIACDNGARGESVWCQPSYGPHLVQNTSTRTSNQITSQVTIADHGERSSFNSSIVSSRNNLSNEDRNDPPSNNGFPELPHEEELEYEDMAQNSTAHGQAGVIAPFVLNKQYKRPYLSWNERFKELVSFKTIYGHTKVPRKYGPLGTWIYVQQTQYCLLKEGKDSRLTMDEYEKLESIGFEFKYRATGMCPSWNQRFQELVDFKKTNGHTNVNTQSGGPLGRWVAKQRTDYRLLKEGKPSSLTTSLTTMDRREKLESIGFTFSLKKHR